MTHSYVWHDSSICVTWLIHMFDMTHSYDSSICVTWLIHMFDMTHSYVWHDSFICVTWRIHMCDMIQSYVWLDSFICVPWLFHTWDKAYTYVWRDSFICVMWLIYMCDDSSIRVIWLIRTHDMLSRVLKRGGGAHVTVMTHAWMSHVTHTNESRHTYERVRWRTQRHTHEWVMAHT